MSDRTRRTQELRLRHSKLKLPLDVLSMKWSRPFKTLSKSKQRTLKCIAQVLIILRSVSNLARFS